MGSGAPVAHALLLAKSKTMHILSVKPLGIERENCIRQQYPSEGKQGDRKGLPYTLGR